MLSGAGALPCNNCHLPAAFPLLQDMSEEEMEEERRQQQQQQASLARGYAYEPAEPHAEGAWVCPGL